MQGDSPILAPDEGPAVTVETPGGAGELLFVCEHASAFIPAALDGLGLSQEARLSHAAWDPGALELSTLLSAHFDAPLVAGRVSRLVYDCNRPPDSPAAVTGRSEVFDVPGNRGLSGAALNRRWDEVGRPFRDCLAALLDRRAVRAMVTIHSFTPVYLGQKREVELGILHDRDSRFADAMLRAAPADAGLVIRRNDPYGPEDGVTHTLREHALPRGLPNVMIEVRNDLLTTRAQVSYMAALLARMIEGALQEFPDEPTVSPHSREETQ